MCVSAVQLDLPENKRIRTRMKKGRRIKGGMREERRDNKGERVCVSAVQP